jgi:pimeloyl-ACP methyl ester carboxylesterase
MENFMQRSIKYLVLISFIISYLSFLISCETTPAKKPTEVALEQGEEKLITKDEFEFSYRYYLLQKKSASVIYVPGLCGHPVKGAYMLAPLLNNAGFNFIVPTYSGHPRGKPCGKAAQSRGKSGLITFPTIEGKESGAENIVHNEIKALIEVIKNAPSHDQEKGIYLIGSSIGAWYSLVTIYYYPESINGVVFVSPSILSDWPEWTQPQKYPDLNAKGYLESLVKAFGNRPGLAIGGNKDIIWSGHSIETAWDSAVFIKEQVGENVEIMEVSTKAHKSFIQDFKIVREKIVQWLKYQVQ